MNSPKVSIIIPCYNQAQFLGEALQSVLDQTYTNWECIIVNDGSPDNTNEIATNWIEKDARFKYLFKENGGVSSARNFGIEKATGDYLQFLDADDVIDKRKIELSLQELSLVVNTEKKIVISNFRMFVNNTNDSTPPFCNLNGQKFNFDTLLYQWNVFFSIPLHCGFFDANLFESIRFPENLSAQEDWVVWVFLFKLGCEAVFIDKPLAFYRRNPTSRMSSRGIQEDQIKAIAIFKTLLDEKEYNKFTLHLISRYYNLNIKYRNELIAIKKSNTYQAGLLIKKVLKTLGILKWCNNLFPLLLKFKKQL